MPTESELASIGRGTVVIVDLEPAKGHEQKKVRPAVVVSSDTLNKALKTLIIVPISSVKPGVQPRSHEVFIRAGEGGSTSIHSRNRFRFARSIELGAS